MCQQRQVEHLFHIYNQCRDKHYHLAWEQLLMLIPNHRFLNLLPRKYKKWRHINSSSAYSTNCHSSPHSAIESLDTRRVPFGDIILGTLVGTVLTPLSSMLNIWDTSNLYWRSNYCNKSKKYDTWVWLKAIDRATEVDSGVWKLRSKRDINLAMKSLPETKIDFQNFGSIKHHFKVWKTQ